MSGEIDLQKLLRSMTAELADGVFVFATVNGSPPPGLNPEMVFRETEGTSLILPLAEAEAAKISYEFPCRKITLAVHSALEAVGFIAAIATELAEFGMGVNPVAGFYHDHLFVPLGREQEALVILRRMAARATAAERPA